MSFYNKAESSRRLLGGDQACSGSAADLMAAAVLHARSQEASQKTVKNRLRAGRNLAPSLTAPVWTQSEPRPRFSLNFSSWVATFRGHMQGGLPWPKSCSRNGWCKENSRGDKVTSKSWQASTNRPRLQVFCCLFVLPLFSVLTRRPGGPSCDSHTRASPGEGSGTGHRQTSVCC